MRRPALRRPGLRRPGLRRPSLRRPGLQRAALPGSVLLMLALVYLIAWGTGSGPRAVADGTASRTVPVTAVTRDCPPPAPGSGQAHVAMLAVPPPGSAATASASTGSAATGFPNAGKNGGTAHGATALAAVPAGSSTGNAPAGTVAGPAAPNALTVLSPPQASQFTGAEVTATGQLAQGFAAEQAASDGTGMVACAHPDSDAWFVGTGTDAGASGMWLYLTNSGSMAASADVTVLTDAGVQSGQDNEFTVPPHRYISMNLASLASHSTAMAVHVQTSSGQVAADLWQAGGSGGAWLPAAAAPSARLVIPGVTASGGAAKLMVVVPGTRDAQVRVTALTARGKTLPLGTTPVDVPAGTASAYPLSSLGGSAAALVLSSSVPVTAGVQIPGSGIGGFTAAGAPLTGQGIVAGNPSGGASTPSLTLSAPDAAARATVTVISSAAGPRQAAPAPAPAPQQTLTIQPGHTVQAAVSPPKGASGPFAIVVTPLPGSGPLYAARVVTSGGTLRSLLPVPSVLSEIRLPPASENYSAVLPSGP